MHVGIFQGGELEGGRVRDREVSGEFLFLGDVQIWVLWVLQNVLDHSHITLIKALRPQPLKPPRPSAPKALSLVLS